jgi:hypothetical protein
VRAHPAGPAGDVERHHDPVARLDLGDAGADLLDDAHRLVAEDVAGVEERPQHLVQVQVRAAQPGAGDPHDRVGGLLDRRVGHRLDADLALSLPRHRTHPACLPIGLGQKPDGVPR